VTRTTSFDAVLVISFGGPRGLDDIRPFLANVVRGRPVPPARLEEVAHHYAEFGGVSPLTEITLRQAVLVEERLRDRHLPVFVGMRNWDPYLADTLWEMADAGVRRAVGFIAAAHRSASSCLQYRQNVADAQQRVRERGGRPPEIIYVSDWHTHPGFIAANAAHIEAARAALPEDRRAAARLVFTAHSLPTRMPGVERYQEQLRESARLVAAQLAWTDWTLAYQSRSGRPQDPWLGPDVVEYLREAHASGVPAAVLSPIGFVCDHIEVLYDLDREAADACREMGLPMARAAAANAHPRFIETMADAVIEMHERYRNGRPLVLVPAETPGG
jgi:ferrochelatase